MGDEEVKKALKELSTLPGAVKGLSTAFGKMSHDDLDVEKFTGILKRNGESGLEAFLREVDLYCDADALPDPTRANLIYRNCTGIAKEELQCLAKTDLSRPDRLKTALRGRFGTSSGLASFFCRRQLADETLGTYLCAIQQIFDGLVSSKPNLATFADSKVRVEMLIQQVIDGCRDRFTRNNVIMEKEDLGGKTWTGARTRILVIGQGQAETCVRAATRRDEFDDDRSPGASASAAVAANSDQNAELMKQMIASQKQMCDMLKIVITKFDSAPVPVPAAESSASGRPPMSELSCKYCKEKGHFLKDCVKLMRKREREQREHQTSSGGAPTPAGLSSSQSGKG